MHRSVSAASVVHDVKDLFARIDELQAEYQSPVLVEQFVEGREFYVGVLGNALRGAADHRNGLLGISGRPAAIASWDAKWGEDGEGKGAEYAGSRSIFPSNRR